MCATILKSRICDLSVVMERFTQSQGQSELTVADRFAIAIDTTGMTTLLAEVRNASRACRRSVDPARRDPYHADGPSRKAASAYGRYRPST
ncbi:MAG: hypothetical protein HC869_22515 [Rhodospirillales bacterium]|nr:hypothetical protein [Rhodospirillales bacterium]